MIEDKNVKYLFILLTDTGTWLSSTIKFVARTPLNHVSISFDEDLTELYSFGRKNLYNPISGGFVTEDITGGVYYRFKETKCKILRLKVTSNQYDSVKNDCKLFYENKNNYSYNFIGLFCLLLKIPIKRENKYFCSEFVSELLENNGIHNFKKPSYFVTPHDFNLQPVMEKLFEGSLREYLELRNIIDKNIWKETNQFLLSKINNIEVIK